MSSGGRASADPPRLTRAERQARTRQALIDAAAEVVVERGLAGASIERIVARAGFTRGAFHSNFGSREELFVELLQQRVYARYAEMAQRIISDGPPESPRETGEMLAKIQADEDAPWMFRLWFELLAAAGRDEHLREQVAEFWRGNSELTVQALEAAARSRGTTPRFDLRVLANAAIALDIGLAIQHFVDPERVGLDTYPEAFEALYAGVEDAGEAAREAPDAATDAT